MKKDCSPSKVRAYKAQRPPTCGCAACWKKYAVACDALCIVGSDGEEIQEALHAATQFFWLRFSQLVHETTDIVASHFDKQELLMRLGDKTSVYGVADA